ncbi:MAG: septum formation initiator family protein [Bacteroidales bacterium]|nr:septum formation initiator family protein [Bacteroidales bacterium]
MNERVRNIGRKIIRNKYFFTFLLFVIWVGLFDKNSLVEQQKYKQRIHELEQQQDYYVSKFKEDSTKLKEFKSPEKLEKFARENFYMKKDNEDLFVIVDETEKK